MGSSPSEHLCVVGIRHVVQGEPAGFMDRADFRQGVAAIGGHDLVYDILIYERQMAEAARFGARSFLRTGGPVIKSSRQA